MESDWPVVSHLKLHYKKFLALLTCSLTVYCIKKLMNRKKPEEKRTKPEKEKQKIKDFPSVEQIQQFIEELPFEAVNCDPNVTLRSLLGELAEFSEDEEWKELIASVHECCGENDTDVAEDFLNGISTADEVLSIHEDENVLTFRSKGPFSSVKTAQHDFDLIVGVYEPAEENLTILDDEDDADYGCTSSRMNNLGEGDYEKEESDLLNDSEDGKEKEETCSPGNAAGDANGHVEILSDDNK